MRKEDYAKLTPERKEQLRATDRKWKLEHKPTPEQRDAKRAYDRKYYREHRDTALTYSRTYSPKWAKRNRPRVNIIQQRHRQKLRTEVLMAYGGQCECCGITELGFLSIDHINNFFN